jgi:mannose-6-phosphate isomerase-like protein (cupin superfamily)
VKERANQLRASLSEIAGWEVVMEGQDMRVVVLTLASRQSVPWHFHSDITDSFVCLEGPMVVETRAPRAAHVLMRSAAQDRSLRSWKGWRPLQIHDPPRGWRVR